MLPVTNRVACILYNIITMKPITFFIISTGFILASCGNAETKADPSQPAIEIKTDTNTKITVPTILPDSANENTSAKGATTSSSEDPTVIITKIDNYLVSSSHFTVGASGGIQNCTITVTNKLPDVTFQKVMVEAIIQKDDGTEISTDYYTTINIEPGLSKLIKIPNTTQGSKVITRIIKIKSNELTKGEWILAGTRYVAPN